jgi:DNA repair exonuclease SbcCD ATPase subunit
VQEAQLQDTDTEYNSLETTVRTINSDISELTAAQETIRQVEARKQELEALLLQDTVYTEYDRLFNKNGIPATLLEQQLELLSGTVNTIFHKYTGKYYFRCVLDRHDDSGIQKIRLLIETTELVPLDYSRLSGFESVLLNIAINKALNDLERKTRSSIFVIDESLDCIDQDRFHQCLPDIFDLLRQNFATVLVISHRDIPRQLVDHNLTINKYQTYSTVDA